MKILVLLPFLVFTTFQCFAQRDPDKLFYLAKAEKYKRMKRTGTLLTVGGSILAIVGIVKIANSPVTTTYYGGSSQTTTSGDAGGTIAFLLGGASMGAGIPLWIVGAHSERKYNRKLEGIMVRVNLNRQASGLGLTYRF